MQWWFPSKIKYFYGCFDSGAGLLRCKGTYTIIEKVSQYNVVSICKVIPLSHSLYLTATEIRLHIEEKNVAAHKYRVKNISIIASSSVLRLFKQDESRTPACYVNMK